MKQWIVLVLCQLCIANGLAEDLDECQHTGTSPAPGEISDVTRKIDKINIVTHPIFDEADKNTIFLHRFANWLHINTKQEVVAERLPFSAGDEVNDNDLAEAERIIRKQAYIRDAKVRFVADCNTEEPATIDVQTWDNWSMIPTVSFGRKGGQNKFSLGLKEDNLLGLGIRTRFKYNKDEQRSGYQLTLKSATPFLMPYSSMMFDYLDNDDGSLVNIEFDRPFYHARTDRMYFASYLSDDKEEDIYQNGSVRNTFANQSHRYEIATGWQIDSSLLLSKRLKIGLVDEQAVFAPALNKPFDPATLPADRRYQYAWLGFESLQRDYRVMSDIYLIEQAEDINLGWHYQAKLGLDFANNPGQSGLGYHLDLALSKGWELNKGLLLVSLAGEGAFNQAHPDHFFVSTSGEYFKRMSPLLGFYSRISASTEHNPYLDKPLTIGDESGVRGYPLQFQHGDHSLSGTLEARLYSGYNIYKILDVGFAGFLDVGKAWGGDEALMNESAQLLSSVGVGARLYSNRSSHQSVVHIDMVKPLTSSPNVNSWEWRLQVKQSF